jgi:hypothetical protein
MVTGHSIDRIGRFAGGPVDEAERRRDIDQYHPCPASPDAKDTVNREREQTQTETLPHNHNNTA